MGSWLFCWWLTLLSLDFQHLYNFWPLIAGLDLTLPLNFPHAFCSWSLKCVICVTPSSLSQSQKRNWIKTGSDSAVYGVAESWTWLSNKHLQKRNKLLFSFVPLLESWSGKLSLFCLAGDLVYFKEEKTFNERKKPKKILMYNNYWRQQAMLGVTSET